MATSATTDYALTWDATGERYLEMGVCQGVLYLLDENNEYTKAYAWNGLTQVTESPSGADVTDLYADNIKYASIRAAETFGATIEAYTYPEEFGVCDGSVNVNGVQIYQQTRQTFGFSYMSVVTNDMGIEENKVHLVYGCTASPSDRAYATINDSPDAITFSWEIETTPVTVSGLDATSLLTINTLTADPDKMKKLYTILYGAKESNLSDDETSGPRLPLPDEVIAIFAEDEDEDEISTTTMY